LREWVNQNAPQDFAVADPPEPLDRLVDPPVPQQPEPANTLAARLIERVDVESIRRQAPLAAARKAGAAVAVLQEGDLRGRLDDPLEVLRFGQYLARNDDENYFAFSVAAERLAPNDVNGLRRVHSLFLSPSARMPLTLDDELQTELSDILNHNVHEDGQRAFAILCELATVSARKLATKHGVAFFQNESQRQPFGGPSSSTSTGASTTTSNTALDPTRNYSEDCSESVDAETMRRLEEFHAAPPRPSWNPFYEASTAETFRGHDGKETTQLEGRGPSSSLHDTERDDMPSTSTGGVSEPIQNAAASDSEGDAAAQPDEILEDEEEVDDDDDDNEADEEEFEPAVPVDVADDEGERLDDIDGIMEAVGMKGRCVLVW
jgi:hypothetical protein